MTAANAAITGLLFVALSLHLRQILEHPVFKPRAALVLVALNLQYRVRAQWSPGAALTLLIRVAYIYAAVSLIVGVGGGFYALDVILLVTLARSMASCWTLLTALEGGITVEGGRSSTR